MTGTKDDRVFVAHILDEASFVLETMSSMTWGMFSDNRLVQGSMKHSVMVIGEAADQISKELKSAHPEIDWEKINYLRNLYVHGYFRIDVRMFWNTLVRYVPKIHGQFSSLMDSLE